MKQKLLSRKFWVAVGTILSGVVMMLGYGEDVASMIVGGVVVVGTSCGYMIAEGVVDAARIKEAFTTTVDVIDKLNDKQ